MSRRKEPKVQIRFGNFNILDQLEICANRNGEKLIPYIRRVLTNHVTKQKAEDTISETADFSAIEAVVILRDMVGDEAADRAQKRVTDYFQEVHDNAKS